MKVLISSTSNEVLPVIEQLLSGNGNEFATTGEARPEVLKELTSEFDFLMLNQTTTVNRRIISRLESREKIVEFSMAKAPILAFRDEVVSLGIIPEHGEQPRKTMSIITDISREGYDEVIQELFSGVNLVTQGSSDFDGQVSELLVKPYIMSLLSRKISDLDYIPRTKEYEQLLDLSRTVTNYNVDYMRDLIRCNPHSGDIFAKVEENLKRVWNELSFY